MNYLSVKDGILLNVDVLPKLSLWSAGGMDVGRRVRPLGECVVRIVRDETTEEFVERIALEQRRGER